MTTGRKVAITVAVLVGALAILGAGSFATFTAQTDNPSNTFASGTLVLGNTKTGGTECLSTGGGSTDTNVNANCDQLFNLTVKKPGDSGSATLTIKNEGSLAATALKVFSTACTPSNASGESYHGTGDPCSAIQVTVQQYSDSAFTTPSACLYGHATGATCDFTDTTKTLSAFVSATGSSAGGVSIGSLAAGASDYFKVSVQLPSSAGNSLQGRQAVVDFDWFAQ